MFVTPIVTIAIVAASKHCSAFVASELLPCVDELLTAIAPMKLVRNLFYDEHIIGAPCRKYFHSFGEKVSEFNDRSDSQQKI